MIASSNGIKIMAASPAPFRISFYCLAESLLKPCSRSNWNLLPTQVWSPKQQTRICSSGHAWRPQPSTLKSKRSGRSSRPAWRIRGSLFRSRRTLGEHARSLLGAACAKGGQSSCASSPSLAERSSRRRRGRSFLGRGFRFTAANWNLESTTNRRR